MFIGAGAIVEAVAIGSNVYIGENCVIGKRTVVKDCCWIMDNTVLTEGKGPEWRNNYKLIDRYIYNGEIIFIQDTVVAPFSIYGGCPGMHV